MFINDFYLIAREKITSFQFSLFGFKMLLLSVLIFIVLFVWLPFLRFNEFFSTLHLKGSHGTKFFSSIHRMPSITPSVWEYYSKLISSLTFKCLNNALNYTLMLKSTNASSVCSGKIFSSSNKFWFQRFFFTRGAFCFKLCPALF